jgi:DNA-binding PucR family transcriptional regulator
VRSYEEAGDAVDLADRLELPDQVVRARDLLVFRVVLRDRLALDDLIETVLLPLTRARGGAGPLLDTVLAYASHGGNATATARSMHLSVRALTYRLQRIAELSGYDPARPDQLYVLYTAALGARLAGVELPALLGDAQFRTSSPSTIAASPRA